VGEKKTGRESKREREEREGEVLPEQVPKGGMHSLGHCP
jgi:hypothetical protein